MILLPDSELETSTVHKSGVGSETWTDGHCTQTAGDARCAVTGVDDQVKWTTSHTDALLFCDPKQFDGSKLRTAQSVS